MPLLHWLTRDHDLTAADRVPYRLLDEVSELSILDPNGGTDGNLLVQGDNLEALRALLPFYAGRVKCIYIDPPYNTGSAFEHYDDSLEHAKWLAMMVPRLQLLREFLREDGSIWVSIDDREGHYLKVVMDEVFGRRNFVANVIWQKKYAPQNDARWLSDSHDHLHCYAKSKESWKPNGLPRSEATSSSYRNPDNDPRGVWMSDNLSVRTYSAATDYPITTPAGVVMSPPRGRCWSVSKERYAELLADNRIWFGVNGTAGPRRKRFLSEVSAGIVPTTIWLRETVGDNQDAKREVRAIKADEVFATPKPERLLQRILHIATNPGDLVLDSFLGSGTTAAVAQKMGRRWIGVEMGDHARTHCALRLKKVIEGEQGGISSDVGWQGGGGFRFCTLGAAVFDGAGRINPAIRFADLARHLWFSEFRVPLAAPTDGPFLGALDGRGLALLYNGILKDRSANGGNVLTHAVLRLIQDEARAAGHSGPITVYGAANRLSERTLTEAGVSFRQTPWDIKARA
ncbi:DNA methylase [Paracoccus sanguinis]|nr:DNA methylase [Paracoccus sanguinis]